jgi:dephospho-CoA kinase
MDLTPKIVGLTGGIGSGKTTVANFFRELDVPVYIADIEAKGLMKRSKVIRRKLIGLFGEKAYLEEELNDKLLLEKMNAIVHPKVATHFKRWVKKQDVPYVIKEAAIVFENNSYKSYDFIITVIAPENLRIERVIKRDDSTKDKVKAIMKNQWKDYEKIKLSDFVVKNLSLNDTKKQVKKIHKQILSKC